MPWLASENPPLPAQDVVTFTFGAPTYDLDRPVYHDLDHPERTISYRQAKTLVRKLVAGFHKAGLKQGDCFSVTSFNDIMFSMIFLGGVGAGGIFSGMNPAYRSHEIRHHIRTANVKFFLAEPDCVEELAKVVKSENLPLSNIFVFNVFGEPLPEGFRSWTWLLEQGEEDWLRITDPEVLKNLELSRLTTSGTTGPPKFAMQTHWNGTSYHTMLSETRTTPWTPRLLSVLPSFHVATVPAVHMSPIRSGWTIFIMRRFDLEAYLAAVERYQITDIGMVPPLVIATIMSPLTNKYSLRSVLKVSVGAAPLDAESQNRLRALCHKDCVATQVWGMTETSSVCTYFVYPDTDDTGSVGNKIMPNTDVKLVDDNGKDITAYDTRGEICVRGPTIVRGYYKNAKANAESWDKDGYFHTGDILYCDSKSKKWYVVDRKKELIKVRGFQVAPPELEGFLLQHPAIVDVAVIGVRLDARHADEKVRAYVVRRAGTNISEEEVKKFVTDNLARYKALTGGVIFVPEIPKSPSGKILKRVLREQVRTESSDKARL